MNSFGNAFQVSDTLFRSLAYCVDVLHCRFEVGRGIFPSGSDMTSIFSVSVPEAESLLLQRIGGRRRFLPTKERSNTYLEDLKSDLEDAGTRREYALKAIRDYIDEYRAPLTWAPDFSWSPASESFFPTSECFKGSAEEYDRDAMADYLLQLVDLQDFLVTQADLKPGLMLPVWTSESPDDDDSRRVISFRGVKKKFTDAMMNLLVQAQGGWPTDSGAGREKFNVKIYDRALRWGRVWKFWEWVEENMYLEANVTMEVFRSWEVEQQREFLEEHWPGYVDIIPETIAAITFLEMDREGEFDDGVYASEVRLLFENLGVRGASENDIMNEPELRQEIRRARRLGRRLFEGEYRNVW